MSDMTVSHSSALMMSESETINVLRSSLYPGAAIESVRMVLGYCKASGLDPFHKPVHIVPMWDSKAGQMRDVVMPGIGLYRTQASRSGEYAGVSEPDFGPDVTEEIGGATVTYPAWCRVSVMRRLVTGEVVAFTAKEFWRENYAVKGGKERSIAPNAMWAKRPYGQIAKCAEAQALRKAFPEFGSQPAAEEMEGKAMQAEVEQLAHIAVPHLSEERYAQISDALDACQSFDDMQKAWMSFTKDERKATSHLKDEAKKRLSEPVGDEPEYGEEGAA